MREPKFEPKRRKFRGNFFHFSEDICPLEEPILAAACAFLVYVLLLSRWHTTTTPSVRPTVASSPNPEYHSPSVPPGIFWNLSRLFPLPDLPTFLPSGMPPTSSPSLHNTFYRLAYNLRLHAQPDCTLTCALNQNPKRPTTLPERVIAPPQDGVRPDLRGSAVCTSFLEVVTYNEDEAWSTSDLPRNDCPLDAKQGFADMAGVLLLFLLLLLLGKAQEKAADYTETRVGGGWGMLATSHRYRREHYVYVFSLFRGDGGKGDAKDDAHAAFRTHLIIHSHAVFPTAFKETQPSLRCPFLSPHTLVPTYTYPRLLLLLISAAPRPTTYTPLPPLLPQLHSAQAYTVKVSSPDPLADDPDRWRRLFAQFGHVSYVTVARGNGSLLRAMADRRAVGRRLEGSTADIAEVGRLVSFFFCSCVVGRCKLANP